MGIPEDGGEQVNKGWEGCGRLIALSGQTGFRSYPLIVSEVLK
jgi:hypothetical protein